MKTGVRAFYNSLSLGYTFDDRYSTGYGIGSMINGKRLAWTFDATGDYFSKNYDSDMDLLARFATGPTIKIGKRLEIFGTANFNYHLFQTGIGINDQLFSTSRGDFESEGFINWSAGIRY